MTGQQFLVGKQITLMPQPVYSPYLAPGDFLLFPSLKWGFWVNVLTLQDIKCKASACERFKTRHSMSAFKRGNTVAASVCMQKGCTSRMIRLENNVQLKFYGLILGTFWETWYFHLLSQSSYSFVPKYFSLFWHTILKKVWPHFLNYSINGQTFCRVGTMWKSYYNDTQNPFWISRSGVVPPNRFSIFSKWRNFNMGSNWYTSVTYNQNSVHTYKFSLLSDH